MLEHYSDDSNYETLTGIIVEIEQSSLLTVELLSSSKGSAERFDAPTQFKSPLKNDDMLAVGDEITFSATMEVFLNGYIKPMLSLEKDGEVLMSILF